VIYVNGQEAGNSADWKQPATLDLTAKLQPGKNVIAIKVTNGGNSPSPAGLVGKLVVLFDSGEPMVSAIDTSWKGNAKSVEGWNTAAFDDTAWGQVSVIAKFGEGPWGDLKTGGGAAAMPPAPYFRKALSLAKPVKRAVVFASALGMYELRVNGQTVGNDVFGPGWTDYHKRVHYFAYDVTSQLKSGANVIGATLGEGWYASYLAFSGRRHYYGGNPRLMLQVQVDYQDGTKEIIGTDDTWKAAFGPIRQADMLMGCIYDARLEMKGWDAPGFDDAKWQRPTVDEEISTALEAHPGEPIRRIQELPARSLKEPKPGVYIFDLGQNMVGWARIKMAGEAGQKVVVRHAEMLNPDGTIYVTNLRAAKATDTYYLSGGAKRAYEPYFTFHGFQYVEITGLTQKPELSDVTGIVVHSDLAPASTYDCSEPLVNKLVQNGVWGQRGNFLDVPTDCPQRDERAGWTGDAQVFMKTACLNLDAPGFFTKWLVDLCDDSQNDQGGFGDVAPHINVVGFGNTGWADSGIVCNYRMYEMYGDTRVLARHYAELERYMAYLARTSQEFVRGTGAYGDWLRLAGPQHSDAIGTAYYFYSAQLMVKVATALGKAQEAEQYRQLATNIREAYIKNFIKEDGRIADKKGETGQSFYALAFGLDLVPAEMHAKVAAQFVETIKKQDWHLATGFLGTPFVLFALEKAGHPELAYQLVLNKTYPSWLQQVIWGSTTMWERWDGWRPDKGFQDPGMNSFNHYWLGCVSEWLYTRSAGIDTEGPGFKRVVINPLLDPSGKGLSRVKATYRTIRGPVSSEWELTNNQFSLRVGVPGNVTAVVHVPAKSAEAVKEGGKPAVKASGVKFLRMENGAALFEVGAGQYHFESAR
jgi:alpha-L-rhamnosidase